MTLLETTERVKKIAEKKSGSIGSKIRFKFDEGVIFLDDSVTPPAINNEDGLPDCVIRLKLDNFNKLLDGNLNPMSAFMMGKIKIDGDMSIAMKLSNMF